MQGSVRRTCGFALLAALGLGACARVRDLEGGTPDTTPPTVRSVDPPDSTVNLSRLPRIVVEWSEPLGSNQARAGVRIDPPVRISDIGVRGNRMTIVVAESLPPDTTVVVTLMKTIQDRAGRDNLLPAEVSLVFSTGPKLRGATVLGRVLVKGRADPLAAVRWEPVPTDTGRAVRRGRTLVAAVDPEGLFRLPGIPPDRPFVLRAFLDRDKDLVPDDEELSGFFPETLLLAPKTVRRGIDWNLIDQNEPGQITGVAINSTPLRGPIAIAVRRILAAPGSRPDSIPPDSLGARADTLRPAPLPVVPRDSVPWGAAYATLEPEGFRRRAWTIVYASARGDYSVRVAPGTHSVIAFLDVRRDSIPGMYVLADSSRLGWEPLVVGEKIFVGPGAKVRARTLELKAR